MAKKYWLIHRTDQNTLRTNYREDLKWAKDNPNRAIHADFTPCRYDGLEIRKNPTEELTNSWSIEFWSPIADVSVTMQYKKVST